jgi:hypothetical protein
MELPVEDELTARQAQIRRLIGRVRETARERKEKGETGLSCLALTKPDGALFICRRYGYNKYATSRRSELGKKEKETNRVLYCPRWAAWRRNND